MRSSFRHSIALLLAVVFGPLTSGYPVVLALCGANDGVPLLCRMTECDDEIPAGSTLTGPACCTPHVVADGVSKTFVKSQTTMFDLLATTDEGCESFMFSSPTPRSLDRQERDPAVHAPPLYITHQAILI